MATVVADTSFRFSLFGRDAPTPAAQRWAEQAQIPLTATALARYELATAFPFAAFRKVISQADALASAGGIWGRAKERPRARGFL